MEAARAYFSHALKLFPNNMRALFGLFMVSNHWRIQGGAPGTSNSFVLVYNFFNVAISGVDASLRG